MGHSERAVEVALAATLGPPGRLISWSKSGYSERHPSHVAIFNANVALSPAIKVWHGDLDLTLDEPLLLDLARRTGRIVYVLYERDGRFEHEEAPLVADAVFSADPSGHTRYQHEWHERARDGSLRWRPPPPETRRRFARVYGRPRLWRFWQVETRRTRESRPDELSALLVYSGRGGRGGPDAPHSPLLVLGFVRGRRPLTFRVEWTWYPTAKRHAPRPLIDISWQRRRGRFRPMLVIRLHPGLAYELRLCLALQLAFARPHARERGS